MRIQYLAAAAMLLTSSTAFAQIKQYGRAGTFEIAGTFTLSNTTSDYDDSGKTERSDMTITPSGGFYIMDSVEALVDVKISDYEQNDVDGSVFGLGAGAGYFLGIGTIRVGPQLLFRYYSSEFGDFKETGPGATVGFAAKVPIGSGGLLISGVNYDYITTTRKGGGVDEDGSVSGYAITAGFGIYF
jgi:hypothetical protein